jgi:hypothetical protein
MTSYRFKTDRNGKKIAQVWSYGACRWIRANVDEAALQVSLGQAEVVEEN